MARKRNWDIRQAKALLDAGLNPPAVAEAVGVNVYTLRSWMRDGAFVQPDYVPPPKAKDHLVTHQRKVTPTTQAVKDLAAKARKAGLSYGELAAQRHPVEVTIPPGLKPAGRKSDGGLEQYTELELLAELSRRVHQKQLDHVELFVSPPDFAKVAHMIKECKNGK